MRHKAFRAQRATNAPHTRCRRALHATSVHSMPESTRSNNAWHANSACYELSNCPSTSSCVVTLPPSFGAQVIVLRGNRLGLNRHGETNDAGLHAIAQTMYAIAATLGPQDRSHPNRSPAAAAPFGRHRSTPSEATGIIEPHDLRSLDLRDNR
jgi:hypothetical protein